MLAWPTASPQDARSSHVVRTQLDTELGCYIALRAQRHIKHQSVRPRAVAQDT